MITGKRGLFGMMPSSANIRDSGLRGRRSRSHDSRRSQPMRRPLRNGLARAGGCVDDECGRCYPAQENAIGIECRHG